MSIVLTDTVILEPEGQGSARMVQSDPNHLYLHAALERVRALLLRLILETEKPVASPDSEPENELREAEKEFAAAQETYLSASHEWLRIKLRAELTPLPGPFAFGNRNRDSIALTNNAAEAVEDRIETARNGLRNADIHVARAVADLHLAKTRQEQRSDFAERQIEAEEAVRDTDLALREIEAQVTAAEIPFLALVENFRLTDFERDTLLLCAAQELDSAISTLCAGAQGDPYQNHPTFGLAAQIFQTPPWVVLSPNCPLRYWRLVEINQPGAQPLLNSALRADERIVAFLTGKNELDARLDLLLSPIDSSETESLTPSQEAVLDEVLRHLRKGGVQLTGQYRTEKERVARIAAAAFNLPLYRLRLERVPTASAEIETFLRLLQRDCVLRPFALFLDSSGSESDPSKSGSLSGSLIRSLLQIGVVLLDSREGISTLETPQVAVAPPTVPEQKALWENNLPDALSDLAPILAGQFRLDADTLQTIATEATETLENETSGAEQDATIAVENRIYERCRLRARPRFDGLAQRIEVRSTWDDLVLPPDTADLLQQIVAQARHRYDIYYAWDFAAHRTRGLGLSVLFAGESGTGKTLAAEVLANELRLDLYRIDLSAVVDKYIGETEKKLCQLFDAAEDGGAILFFDEADALFGKRTEVKDSHDRYANIEVNYLLQRMEEYTGVAILATNLKSALDKAFTRRLRFIVTFPFPGESERSRIWERSFPASALASGTNWSAFWNHAARLNLSGGSITNIALNAAFLAAAEKTNRFITSELIRRAIRDEFRKMEKSFSERDLPGDIA